MSTVFSVVVTEVVKRKCKTKAATAATAATKVAKTQKSGDAVAARAEVPVTKRMKLTRV